MTRDSLYWLILISFFIGRGYDSMKDHPANNLMLFGVFTCAICLSEMFDRWRERFATESGFELLRTFGSDTKARRVIDESEQAMIQSERSENDPRRRFTCLGCAFAFALFALLCTWIESH